MNTAPGRLAVIICLLLAAACGSTPQSNYYLLDALAEPSGASNGPAIGIGPIVTAEYLNRDNMVMQRQDGGLEIATFERWAEPLDDGMKRVISLNMAALLDTGSVQVFPWRRDDKPDYAVQVNVLQLDSRSGSASLIAEWVVTDVEDNRSVKRQLSRLQLPLDSSQMYGQLPGVYSRLLLQLSEQIAASIEADARQAQAP